jgi:hypothetical protein
VFSIAYVGFSYYQELRHTSAKRYLDHQLLLFNKSIDEEERMALSMSVLLSKNPHIVACAKAKDKSACAQVVEEVLDTLSPLSHYDIKIHIHTDELKSLLRSWPQAGRERDNLEDFRQTLIRVKNTQKPLSGIEAGRAGMFLRGVSPIMEGDTYVGSIEVMFDFEHMTQFFAHQAVDLYILMDKRLGPILDTLDQRQADVLSEYVIINKSTNIEAAFLINNLLLEETSFHQIEEYYYTNVPIYNIDGESIGYYLLAINTEKQGRWQRVGPSLLEAKRLF